MRRVCAIAVAASIGLCAGSSRADVAPVGGPPADETSALFADGMRALSEGRPGDAIANFEALADRGVVDPVVSFDRGLAYADRVRGRSKTPGDLGRAALGFEEARALTHDPTLAADATRALGAVRAEIAHGRALAGEPVEVDPGVPLGRAIVGLASEDVWSAMAGVGSFALAAALFFRRLATARRARIGAAIAIAGAGPLLAGGGILALAARDERLHLREGILVSESARLADERHIARPGAALPEGARVTIEESGGGWARVRFGGDRGWIPSASIRPLARPQDQ